MISDSARVTLPADAPQMRAVSTRVQLGTPARVQEFRGRGLRGHMQINRQLGEPGYPATPVVDTYLAQIFGT